MHYVIMFMTIWTVVGFLSTMKLILIDKTYQNYCKVAKGEKFKKYGDGENEPVTITRYIMVGTLLGFFTLIIEICRNLFVNNKKARP